MIIFISFLILCTATIYIGYKTSPTVKSLSDDELIESLPRYINMQKNTFTAFNYCQYISYDEQIDSIKKETKKRFNIKSNMSNAFKNSSLKTVVNELLNKKNNAAALNNKFAENLINKQLHNITH